METETPHPDEDLIEESMLKIAQDANAAHHIRMEALAESKSGRSTANTTTSFSSDGTFSTNTTKDPLVTAFLNDVLESFNALAVQRKHIARYDLQFTIDMTESPEEEIREAVVEIFQKLSTADSKIVWYPWAASDATGKNPREKTIMSGEQFPTSWSEIRKYLPGLRPRYEGGTIYSSIWMGSAKPLPTLMEEVGHWFKHCKHGIYTKHIQAEQQFVVGWLLYSINTMDTTKLQQVLEQRLGFPVHARWQIINTGNNRELKEGDKHRALHFRVDKNLQDQALMILSEIYSSKAKNFPLNYKMRLTPQKERMLNPRNAEVFEECRVRQGSFVANMSTIQSWEISALYTQSPRVPESLHDLLMAIQSPNLPGTQLFHCADKTTVKAPCTLRVHPLDETHGRALVAGLIPYLRHVIRQIRPKEEAFSTEEHKFMSRHLYRFFNETAVKRSMGCEWSEEEGGVTSRGEFEVRAFLEQDDDYNFAAPEVEETIEIPTGALPPAQYQTGEDDSISTFRSKKATVRQVNANVSFTANKTDAPSTGTNSKADDSTIQSKSTTSSKRSSKSNSSRSTTGVTSELTSSMDQLNSNVNGMQAQFLALMNKIDTMNNRVGVLEIATPKGVKITTTPAVPSQPPEKEVGTL